MQKNAMEKTQPLKKRVVEIPSTLTEQKETQRTSRIREYCQYLPIATVKAQLSPVRRRKQQQRSKQKQPQGTPQRPSQMSPKKLSQMRLQMSSQMPPPNTSQIPAQKPQQMPPQKSPQMQPQRSSLPPQLQTQPPQQQQQIKLQSGPQSQTQTHTQAQTQMQVKAEVQTHPQSVAAFIEIPNYQDQSVNNGIQIIEHLYKEPPMMLNAWTQTNAEDQPKVAQDLRDLQNAALLAKIKSLEESLEESYAYINANLNVTVTSAEEIEEEDKTPTTSPAIKNEVQTYRILSQGNEYSGEDNIEIELSVDAEEFDDENVPPSPKVYKICGAANDETPKSDQKELSPTTEVHDGSPKALNSQFTYITIGPNKTNVPEVEFNKINWSTASIATRKLLTLIFDRETLATHSMTGKASPAFKDLDKPVKGRLDPNAVQDIICVVSEKCKVSPKEVRSAITTKCADENKMLKLKAIKQLNEEGKKRPILGELRPRNSGQAKKNNGK